MRPNWSDLEDPKATIVERDAAPPNPLTGGAQAGARDLDSLLSRLNSSERVEFECLMQAELWAHARPRDVPTCAPSFDRISCWPGSPADQLTVIPCFAELNGVKYDTQGEDTKTFLFLAYLYAKATQIKGLRLEDTNGAPPCSTLQARHQIGFSAGNFSSSISFCLARSLALGRHSHGAAGILQAK